LFLGPAPERPYNPVYQPFKWRGWWDYGTGALGDMACHIMDPAFWALHIAEAKSFEIEAQTGPFTWESPPNWSIIRYEIPARANMPGASLTWYDGKKKPSKDLFEVTDESKIPDNGSVFVGEKGKILIETYGGNPRLIPESKKMEIPVPKKTIPRVAGHYEEFITACKGGTPAGSNFDYAGPFTEFVHLGNLALRTGKRIEWDVAALKAKNVPEAAQYVHREYRKGWTL
jgi:predicted dehydrogenase